MAKRPITTLEHVQAALRELVGPEGTVTVQYRVYEHFSPGHRYVSVGWGGSISVEVDGEEQLWVHVHDEKTPAALVAGVARALKRAVSERAEARRQKRVNGRAAPGPKRVGVVEPRRLTFSPD